MKCLRVQADLGEGVVPVRQAKVHDHQAEVVSEGIGYEEPLARAQTLVDILGELIDEINAQIFATPSGPTSKGPENRGNFSKIKSKLDDQNQLI